MSKVALLIFSPVSYAVPELIPAVSQQLTPAVKLRRRDRVTLPPKITKLEQEDVRSQKKDTDTKVKRCNTHIDIMILVDVSNFDVEVGGDD